MSTLFGTQFILRTHNKREKFQGNQQEFVDQTSCYNKITFRQSIDAIQPKRPLRAVLRHNVVSALIKIIIFTDNIVSSLFPEFLSKYFISVDIDVIQHQNEESFLGSVVPDESITHFIIIKSKRHVRNLIDRVHSYKTVHSLYLQCESDDLKYQQRLARNYSKLNSVFDDSLRLLVTLVMDIALFCEEKADRQKDDGLLTSIIQENYQRSADLYALAERLII